MTVTAATGSDSGQSAQPSGKVFTRRLNAHIRGSINNFANAGTDSACWTTQNGRINDIMGINSLVDGTGEQNGTQLLKQSVLKKVTVLEVCNQHPVSLGVHLSCVPGLECTRTGHKYAFTALPTSHNAQPLVLYENDSLSSDSLLWRTQYPEYNNENLESHNVLNVTGEPFLFVHHEHPAIGLLRANKNILNVDIDTHKRIDGTWYKVTRQVMSACCQELRKKVLTDMSTDLNEIRVQISRLDGLTWKDCCANDELLASLPVKLSQSMGTCASSDPAEIAAWKQEGENRKMQFNSHMQGVMEQKNSFIMRFELQFELLPTVVGG